MWGRVIWYLLPSFRKNLRLRLFWNSTFLRSGSNRPQNYTASCDVRPCNLVLVTVVSEESSAPSVLKLRFFEVVVTDNKTARRPVMWGCVIWYLLPSFRKNLQLRLFWNNTFLRSSSNRPQNYTASCDGRPCNLVLVTVVSEEPSAPSVLKQYVSSKW